MGDVLFFGLIFLASLMFITHGLLMLCSPRLHAKFLKWWAGSTLSAGTTTGSSELQLEKRVVGVVLLLMGLYAARAAIRGFVTWAGY